MVASANFSRLDLWCASVQRRVMRLVANFIAPTFAYQSRRAGGRITVFTYFMSTAIFTFIATRTHKLAASEKIKDLVVHFISIIVDM